MKDSKGRVGINPNAWRPKNEEEFKEIQDGLKNAKPLLDKLTAVLHRKAVAQFPKLEDFDNPNWAYRRAFNDGYLKALHEVEMLINLDQKETVKDVSTRPKR